MHITIGRACMNKIEKQMDKKIVKVLTDVCEKAKYDLDGFAWLTHLADYKAFPQSLKVICVFHNQEALSTSIENGQRQRLIDFIQRGFSDVNIQIKQLNKHIIFDNDEDGASEKWL